MRRVVLLLASLAVATGPAAAQYVAKPKLTGTWKLAPEKSELKAWKPAQVTLQIEHVKAEIRGTEIVLAAEGGERKREFTCSTRGVECTFTDGTMPVAMTLFFDGATLVGFERIGRNGETVQRRTYALSEDGQSLTVHIKQIVPVRAEVDKLVLLKQETVAQAQ